MVYGVLKLINFAHDAVFALGGIVVYYVVGQWFGANGPYSGIGLIFMVLVILLVGGIGSAIGAVLLERIAYRPLRKRNAARLSYLIGAIGASFFATYAFQQGFLLGPAKRGFPTLFASGPTAFSLNILDSRVIAPELLVVVAAVVCFFV